MEDVKIIGLYFDRDERAVSETDKKYGPFCHTVAYNILSLRQDAEECVSDTYLKAWNSIPPERPLCFKAWLGRVVRNISLSLWRKNHRQKRYAGIEELFDELEESLPSSENAESRVESAELTEFLNRWLEGLDEGDRILFVRRYWYGDPLKELAAQFGISQREASNRMYRLRQKLKSALEKEGIYV